jgi:hypothetical protein
MLLEEKFSADYYFMLSANKAEHTSLDSLRKRICTKRAGCRVTRWGEFSTIGRLFTLGAAFYENYRSSPKIWLLFPRIRLCINFDKISWATFWAIFLTRKSGHPARMDLPGKRKTI